jgi:hypothetical protein
MASVNHAAALNATALPRNLPRLHPTPCKCLSEKDFPEEGFLAVGSIESDAK